MPRKPIAEKPMTDVERRRKSCAGKLQRGEHHLTIWISADATDALHKMIGIGPERGAIKAAVEQALINEAKRKLD